MPAVPRHRQRIIDAAVTLFRRQVYSKTGLNDIVEASGAPIESTADELGKLLEAHDLYAKQR